MNIMNRQDNLQTMVEPTVNQDSDRPQGSLRRVDAARSLALLDEPKALTTRELEDRRVIHRNDSVREQADAFRELRTRLLAAGGERNFVTLVAPVSHGCGGSFVARNLAAAFAFDDTKTSLLIDCDVLHPSQHSALRVDTSSGGLMDYLEDGSLDVAKVLYRTGVPRLRLIPSGRQRETTGESFSSFRMRAMIDSVRSRYSDRYIILDSPSVLGSPDARILSELADLVVLVAGYGLVTPEKIEAALASFPPEKVAGVVFNHLP
ncbi:MAG TPA: polysaccharide biosynthesis protein [Pseudoxanthomonas sp.]